MYTVAWIVLGALAAVGTVIGFGMVVHVLRDTVLGRWVNIAFASFFGILSIALGSISVFCFSQAGGPFTECYDVYDEGVVTEVCVEVDSNGHPL